MTPKIPSYIIVHLGLPDDYNAENVRVPFTEYIKNVASSEIYPDWPENAIRANIHAQISFALNRIYTEWYRSRGYDFDITNTTAFDQRYNENGEIFDTVSDITDEIFNIYIAREGRVEPLFARFCNGTTSVCDGLSQWGSVELANKGYSPLEILRYYYGDDIELRQAPVVSAASASYPGYPLKLGDTLEDVRTVQKELNRISDNYPYIIGDSKLREDGFFGTKTEAAVKRFQEVFNLNVTGVVNESTWYKIKSIYIGVKGLGELFGEGLTLDDISRIFKQSYSVGDSGRGVKVVQYYLDVIAYFDDAVPFVKVDGYYDNETAEAIKAFQRSRGISVDGITGRQTWNALTSSYANILASIPEEYQPYKREIFPGRILDEGFRGEDVRLLQELINRASQISPTIPGVEEDGIFGPATRAAVLYIQESFGLPANGLVGPITWETISAIQRPEERTVSL